MKPVGNGKLSKRDGDKMGFCVSIGLENQKAFHQVTEKRIFPEAVINF
jgi:hypothetical protein